MIDWFDNNRKLDKNSGLYSKKSERKFREKIEQFINWLKDEESDSESDSDFSSEDQVKENERIARVL